MPCVNCGTEINNSGSSRATLTLHKMGNDVHLGMLIIRCCECSCEDEVINCFDDNIKVANVSADCQAVTCLDDALICDEVA